jgi:hypothetical protein
MATPLCCLLADCARQTVLVVFLPGDDGPEGVAPWMGWKALHYKKFIIYKGLRPNGRRCLFLSSYLLFLMGFFVSVSSADAGRKTACG